MCATPSTPATARMTTIPRPSDLPDFEQPPVDEVVLSIQFGTVPAFQNARAGLFWNRIRSVYPLVSEQPPIAPVFETFGPGVQAAPFGLQFQASFAPPTPRFWFEDSSGVDLLQLQQDRILHNWRKRQATQEYPHYEAIRDRFEKEVYELADFMRAEKLDDLRPNQCEVTYINAIRLPDDTNPQRHLEQITPLWKGETAPVEGEAELTVLQHRYVIHDGDKPFGRTYVNFAPAFTMLDSAPVVRLEITVRARPRDESIGEAFRLLDYERGVVVRTFAAVTTKTMHDFWRRKQ